jgi:hypothetical protein
MDFNSSKYLNLDIGSITSIHDTSLMKNNKTNAVVFTVQVSQLYQWYFGYVELWKS